MQAPAAIASITPHRRNTLGRAPVLFALPNRRSLLDNGRSLSATTIQSSFHVRYWARSEALRTFSVPELTEFFDGCMLSGPPPNRTSGSVGRQINGVAR